ncbi:MAG: thiopurine S-methyltransferase [Oleiphilaceae bacterium]|nr:thiopurine S-methyltransferase [Oleiphilaceae bacterium]
MDPEFWQHIWQERQIGFHRADVHPALKAFWPEVTGSGPVLVPLCGKTLDMHWLAAQGHPVTGIELSEQAITEFFREGGLTPERGSNGNGQPTWSAGEITLVCGDFFAFKPPAPYRCFYDRAALVALPKAMRERYLRHLARCIAPGGEGLLITFEYDPDSMEGPPFPVFASELQEQPYFAVEKLAGEGSGQSHPGLMARGANSLTECVYRLIKRALPAHHTGG